MIRGMRCESIQTAAFVVQSDGRPARFALGGGGERLRCASVLKPLVFWAADRLEPLRSDPARWERLARDAVVVSANAPTVEAWESCGGARLLDALAERVGVGFELEAGGERSFGRVLVDAADVARGYASLAASAQASAGRLLGWMRAVPERQTFGVRPIVARRLGVPQSAVAVKCGWFCDSDEQRIRTHVVTVTHTPAGAVGTVVLTALAFGEADRQAYAAAYSDGDEVLGWHERCAGEIVRAAGARALGAVADG
jgi:hypothetical protein